MTAKKPINMLSNELVEAANAAKTSNDTETFASVLEELRRRVAKGGSRFAKKALKSVEGLSIGIAPTPTVVTVETPPTAVSTEPSTPAPVMAFVAPSAPVVRVRKPTIV